MQKILFAATRYVQSIELFLASGCDFACQQEISVVEMDFMCWFWLYGNIFKRDLMGNSITPFEFHTPPVEDLRNI